MMEAVLQNYYFSYLSKHKDYLSKLENGNQLHRHRNYDISFLIFFVLLFFSIGRNNEILISPPSGDVVDKKKTLIFHIVHPSLLPQKIRFPSTFIFSNLGFCRRRKTSMQATSFSSRPQNTN
jgi:hypothetical protein